MIERYVFIKLAEQHASESGRSEVAARLAALSELEGVVDVRVGIPADEAAAGAWDVSVCVRFESLADVEAYRVHPRHRALVDEFLKPRMEVIKAWNFEV